jgi:hypothetical protein
MNGAVAVTGTEFTRWMKIMRLRVADVASQTGLDPNTIYAFRRGEVVRRTTTDILLRFMAEYNQHPLRAAGR